MVWNKNFIFPYIGNFIIPTDFQSIIFQRGRCTTNQMMNKDNHSLPDRAPPGSLSAHWGPPALGKIEHGFHRPKWCSKKMVAYWFSKRELSGLSRQLGALILNLHRLAGKSTDDFPVKTDEYLKFTGDLPLPGLMTSGNMWDLRRRKSPPLRRSVCVWRWRNVRNQAAVMDFFLLMQKWNSRLFGIDVRKILEWYHLDI